MSKSRRPGTAVRMAALIATASIFFSPLQAGAQTPASVKPPSSSGDARYIKSSRVNVRSGPGTNHAAIDVATLGNEVHVYFSQGDWSRISPPGQTERWVYTPLLQSDAPAAPKTFSKPEEKPQGNTRHENPTKEYSPQQGRPDPGDGVSEDRSREHNKPSDTPG
jgi:uncharacterized protein YraI